MMEETIEAQQFARLYLDRLLVSVTPVSIPFFPKPAAFSPAKFRRRDSARHNDLKYSGLLWLMSQGFHDAELEGEAYYGTADVISKLGKITIECGNCPIERLHSILVSDEPSMFILPLWGVVGEQASGFLFHVRAHGRIQGWIEQEMQLHRIITSTERLNFGLLPAIEAPYA